MIRTLALATALLAPSLALANGSNLFLIAPAFDTSTPYLGSGAALSGGIGVSLPGACYQNVPSVPTVASFGKTIFAKAPTALPSAPQLIFGDAGAYIAENTSGYPVFGAGQAFVVGTTKINDDAWHSLSVEMVYEPVADPRQPYPTNPEPTLTGFVDSTGAPSYQNYGLAGLFSASSSQSTGVLGGGSLALAPNNVANFSGEVEQAQCMVSGYTVASWPLNQSGADTSASLLSFNPPYSPPASAYPAPSGGFPLQ